MTKILTIMLFVLCSPAFGQIDTEYKELLIEMFELNGTEATNKAVMGQMIEIFKQHYPNVPSETWDDFGNEFRQTSLNELIEMLMPIYYKYLTKSDIQELIRFYRTPVGMKYAKNTPFLVEESMQVGQKWGEKIGREFAKKLEMKED